MARRTSKKANHLIKLGIFAIIFLITLMVVINTRSEMTYGLELQGNGYGLKVEFEDEQGKLFDIPAMAPGEIYTEVLTIKNVGKDKFTYSITSKDTSDGGQFLYNALKIVISENEIEVFNGNLNELINKKLGTLYPGLSRKLTLALSLPAESNDDYQDKSTSMEFVIAADGIAPSDGGNDDDSNTDDNMGYTGGGGGDFERIGGGNRIETAIAISQVGWPDGAPAVVLARDDDFPDALAGTPLAFNADAPILLTNKLTLTPETENEIKRLEAKEVYILGGPAAISKGIENHLKNQGYRVIRIGGIDRFETAASIAKRLDFKGTAVLAYGFDFPDTLAISPWAAANRVPILLTYKDSIPVITQTMLKDLEVIETLVVGGTGVVSDTVAANVPGMKRFAGDNRYQTAIKIIESLGLPDSRLCFVTGEQFPDALAGSVLAVKSEAFLVLLDKDLSEPVTREFLAKHKGWVAPAYVFGGPGAVSDRVLEEISKIVGSKS